MTQAALRPNMFIIGAPKSGTTSLVHYLRSHPNAFLSNPKEPGYWATDFPWLARRNALPTLDHYLELFSRAAPAHVAVGEASTTYLRSSEAVANILRFNPRALFIVMLRNPVEVALGLHMQKLLVFQEDEPDFETAWRLQARRLAGERLPRFCLSPLLTQYGRMPAFGDQVQALLATVSREQVCFVRYEDFCSDTRGQYRRVLDFLGLPDDGRTEFPVVGPSRKHRYPLLAQLYLAPPEWISMPFIGLRRHLVRQDYPFVKRLKRRMYAPQPRAPISADLHEEMVQHFAPQVRLLESLLGWELSAWRSGSAGTVS